MQTKVLLIEDDAMVREAYQEALQGAGFNVTVAINGEDGLEKAQQGGFNIIFLDVMMPKMDGLQVLKQLSEKPPAVANGPIWLLTNLSHDPVITQAMDLGAGGALIKSDIDPGQLIEAVKKNASTSEVKTEEQSA